jgi:hypothetical protein
MSQKNEETEPQEDPMSHKNEATEHQEALNEPQE